MAEEITVNEESNVDNGTEVVENTTETTDTSYDADIKNDFEVPTEGSLEEDQLLDDVRKEEETEDQTHNEIKEAMMEYLKENYELPDKFKDVESLINSYKHLESKLGSLKGAPEEYEINEDVYENFGEEVLEGIVPVAKEMGLDNDGLNKLLDTAMKSQELAQQARWNIEKQKLGPNPDDVIADALARLNSTFDPEISQTIQGMVQTAEEFNALKTILDRVQPSQPAQEPSKTEYSEEDIQGMLFAKDDFGNLKVEVDPEYERKVKRLMNQVWGN